MTPYRQRKSPRLQGYDYSQAGAYFITICTHHRAHVFGEIQNSVMQLNLNGHIAMERWEAIPEHYPDVETDAFVVMPNHVHGILVLTGDSDFKTVLGHVVNGYKGAVTVGIRSTHPGMIVWQPRYHDHIIRDETGLNRIRHYIVSNPALWSQDTFFA